MRVVTHFLWCLILCLAFLAAKPAAAYWLHTLDPNSAPRYWPALKAQGDYLWMGVTGGVVRWKISNKEHTVYDLTTAGLPDFDIYSLGIDSSGNPWVATPSGIA